MLNASSGFFKCETYQLILNKCGYEEKAIEIETIVYGEYFDNILFVGLIALLNVDLAMGVLFELVECVETQRLGMQWFHVPIEDDCAPAEDFQNNWKASREALHQAIENGNKVVMHCMGGSGRTGLLAAHLLLERNWTLEEIVRDVQALRPGAFTKPLQVEYIGTLVK
ncbi:dual specificity protein phosphatase family protein [Enterovibrio norvegicus]|uniref:Tyrosine specific protein phosphatases domain-containing protein n=2 Tax=Enterovibrio norvegicus TaxID=188144 RepID=A0A2N7L798_9GAMM|nr:dual specificity protein phosphatase family protein [Enterovibrio norvegicus]PMN89763.1 hypothetical protein BCT23_21865 [Enterovibrio norvegicus]